MNIKSFLNAIQKYISILPMFLELENNISRLYQYEQKNYFYHSLNDLIHQCVNREDYLIDITKNKDVLHFGFLDTPFTKEKIESGNLLHLKIKNNAKFIYGVDIDKESLNIYQNLTHDYNNIIFDIQKNDLYPDILLNRFDIILFPEILEHLLYPTQALQNLKNLCILNNNAKVLITVPNAFSMYGFYAAMNGIEIVHPNHYFYFSPITLKKLLNDTGFTNIRLLLYNSPSLNSKGITQNGLIAICSP